MIPSNPTPTTTPSPRAVRRTVLVLATLLVGCSAQEASSQRGDAGDEAATSDASDEGLGCGFCADDDARPDGPLVLQVKGRIDQICANADGCHGSGQAGLGLSAGDEFAPMIGMRSTERPDMLRVKPGDPLQSYVYLKLWCDGGIDGGCMPLGQTPSPSLAQLFHDWIEAGAPTN